ncbi:glycerophosphodiester phosphodiesterase [Streptosporangiaceae bacterium NEAU-GS5]|nr:glycerophosphodiester phosphodiesterase [Streptosporangiaceae bacterium NEAU-GS5]
MWSQLTALTIRPQGQRRPAEILRIAHRGAGGGHKYSASDLATVRSQGAHMVEFDLHVTADDQLVVRHDPIVGAGRRWLADYPLSDLRKDLEGEGSPCIEEVIRAARSVDLGLYVDIKTLTHEAGRRLVDLLRAEEMDTRTILASVRSDLVGMCAKLAPHIPRSVLFASTLEEPLQLAAMVAADFVHPCWERYPRPDRLLADGWLERVRSAGLGVICWHEEREDVLNQLCKLGVDGICSDTPLLLTQVARRAHESGLPDKD